MFDFIFIGNQSTNIGYKKSKKYQRIAENRVINTDFKLRILEGKDDELRRS